MSRLVEAVPRETASAPGAATLSSADDRTRTEKLKDYGERVAKYVPAEVIAFYTACVQLIASREGAAAHGWRLTLFGIFTLIAWLATPFILGRYSAERATRVPNQIIGFIAFGIWAYAFPAGIAAELGRYDPLVAGLILLAFTFGIGLYQPTKD